MFKMTFAIKIKIKETGVRAIFSIFNILLGDEFCYV